MTSTKNKPTTDPRTLIIAEYHDEIWKDVVGYEGLYKISNKGNIKSIYKCNLIDGNAIGGWINRGGYKIVDLFKNKQKKHVAIHRLVAIAFIEQEDDKPHVNHKDGNKLNNCHTNLEWCTQADNNRHAFKTGLNKGGAFGKFGSEHHLSTPIIQLTKNGDFIKEFGSQREAMRETGVWQNNITKVLNGKLHTTGGFKWQFKNKYYEKI